MTTFERLQLVKEMITQLVVYSLSKNMKISKQKVLDADLTEIQQINFTRNLERAESTTMFFIIEEAKEIILNFSEGTVKVL